MNLFYKNRKQNGFLFKINIDYYSLMLNVIILLSLVTSFPTCLVTYALPFAEVHVDGYKELEEPFYPFQQYIQVRKTYTVEHVPIDHGSSSEPNLSTSASNSNSQNSGDYDTTSSSNGGEDQYHVPRLREEVHDYKKHEVYEEKGYGDSDYDHYSYPSYNDHNSEGSSHGSGKYSKSLHTPDGSSSRILEYVASNLHDTDAHRKGIYAARGDIHCPEFIDFNLSSKSMRMGQGWRGGAKPRLRGLGSKIKCMKERYFGREPLPRAIFDDPSESRHSVIQVPSFHSFFDIMRRDIDSSSSFQNSKVPDLK